MSDRCGTWTRRLSTSLYFEKCCWRGCDQAWVCENVLLSYFRRHSLSFSCKHPVAFNSRSPVPTTLLSVFDFIVFFQIASLSAFQQATSQWWWCFCPLSWCFWWRPLRLGFLIWVSYTYARQLQCVVFLKPTSLLSIPTIWRLATMCDTGKSRLMPLETLDANPIGVEELARHI